MADNRWDWVLRALYTCRFAMRLVPLLRRVPWLRPLPLIALVAAAGDLRTAIHIVDLAGRDVDSYGDFTRVQKWQTALTNLQQYGDTRGIKHDVFSLDPIASKVDLVISEEGMIVAHADGRR